MQMHMSRTRASHTCVGCAAGKRAVSMRCARGRWPTESALCLLEPEGSAKIGEVTLMRPIHGNL